MENERATDTSIRMDTMCYVQDKCANCGHNVDSAGQMGAHTRELWRRRRSTLLTTASDNSRGVKSLGKPSLFSRRAALLWKCIHHLCIITLSVRFMRGNDTPCEEGVKRMREVTSVGKRRKMTEGREETSNAGEKPFLWNWVTWKGFEPSVRKCHGKLHAKIF